MLTTTSKKKLTKRLTKVFGFTNQRAREIIERLEVNVDRERLPADVDIYLGYIDDAGDPSPNPDDLDAVLGFAATHLGSNVILGYPGSMR